MIIPNLMLNTAAAMMVLLVLRYHRPWALQMGRRGFVLVLAGIWLLPLDVFLDFLGAPDQVGFLLGPRFLHTPLYGLAAIALCALLYAYVVGGRRAYQDGLFVGAGYLLHVALLVFTPEGIPLLAPFWFGRVALPIQQEGHVVLTVVLALCITLLEGFPNQWRRVLVGTLGVVVLYFSAGVGALGAMAYMTFDLTQPGETWLANPINPWLTNWQITYASAQKYRVIQVKVGDEQPVRPEVFFRYNAEAPLTRLTRDPVIAAFIARWFDHPMYQATVSDDRVSLMVEELPSVTPTGHGRSVMLEEDLLGGKPQYTPQGFIIDLPILGLSL